MTPPLTVAIARERVAAAEAGLRTSLLEASYDVSPGTRAQVQLRLDTGDSARPAGFHLSTTYLRADSQETIEYLALGDRYWRRLPGQDWRTMAPQPGLWDHVRTFLPQVGWRERLELSQDGAYPSLRWRDAGQTVEASLQFEPSSGVPRQWRQVAPATGLTRTVTYRGWNVPVEIAAPPAAG